MKCFELYYRLPKKISKDFDIVHFMDEHKIEITVAELVNYTKEFHYCLCAGSDNDLTFQLLDDVDSRLDVPYLLFYEFRTDEELKEFWRSINAKKS